VNRRTWQVAQAVASLTLAAGLLVFGLPKVTGAGWGQIAGVLGRLPLAQILLLFVVWVAGLYAYTFVLTAALPRLTRTEAYALNLAGSAVSNLVPFGGAVGVAVNFAMVRSWGFRPSSFALFTLVTGLWNVLARLALPLVALAGLVVAGRIADPRIALAAEVSAVLLAVVIVAMVAALVSERQAVRLGGLLDRVAHRLRRRIRRLSEVNWQHNLVDLRHRTIGLLKRSWPQLTLGMVGYLLLQALLLWLILRMLGSTLPVVDVFAAFALGRLLTSVVITPSGVGISETGTAALLVAFGGSPAVSAAAVVLFGGFTYAIEIPAGVVGAVLWWWRRRSTERAAEDPAR